MLSETESSVKDFESVLAEAHDLLTEISNLYFTTVGTTIPRQMLNALYQLVKWVTLLIAGATTAWLYVKPSLAFGERYHSEELGQLEVVGNVICAMLVTINISRLFMNYLENTNYAKKQLGEWRRKISRLASLAEIIKNSAIVTGAGISALPLVAPAWEFSTSYPLWLRILQASGMGLAYTLVHTFPMMLLVRTNVRYLLAAPFYALYYPLYEIPRNLLRSTKTLLEEQTHFDHATLKQRLQGNIQASVALLSSDGFKRDLKWLRYKQNLEVEIPGLNLSFDTANPTRGLDHYIRIIQAAKQLTPTTPRQFPNVINYLLLTVGFFVWAFGATLVTVGIAGFAASEYNQTKLITGSIVAAILITILPVFITGILTSYYGGNAFLRPFNAATALIKKETVMPVSFRLYPKAFLLLQFLNLLLALFSSGPATELVYTNIPESWGVGREILAQSAFWGVIIYCMINLYAILGDGIMAYARLFGGDFSNLIATLFDRANAFCLAIDMADGNALEASLKSLTQETRELLLGMDDATFNQLCDHRGNLKNNLGSRRYLLWHKPTPDEVDALQTLNSEKTKTYS